MVKPQLGTIYLQNQTPYLNKKIVKILLLVQRFLAHLSRLSFLVHQYDPESMNDILGISLLMCWGFILISVLFIAVDKTPQKKKNGIFSWNSHLKKIICCGGHWKYLTAQIIPMSIHNMILLRDEKNNLDTVQSLYNTMFWVQRNGPCEVNHVIKGQFYKGIIS